MASFQNSSSSFSKKNINLSSNDLNNINSQVTSFSYAPFDAVTETVDLDFDTVDEVSLDSKVTKSNIFSMSSLINDGYEKQKTNYCDIKKSAENEKNSFDNKFNSLIGKSVSSNNSVEEEAGVSYESTAKQTQSDTIETLTNDTYKDLSEFFEKYHENKKQAEVNQNMLAPGETGNKEYQNKVNLMTEFAKKNFDVNSVEELEKKYNEINSTIFNATQAMEFIDHCKETTKYDLITKLDDYQNYEPSSINSFSLDTSGTSSNTSYIYNGNGSPLEALKAFKKNYQGVNLSGIDSNIYTLYEANLANPNLGKLYSYIYDTEGKDAADKYLKVMEDDINKIVGEKKAAEFLDGLKGKDKDSASDVILNHLKVTGKGLGDGFESYFDGLEAWFSTSNQKTVDDYEKMYIIQALMSEEDKEKLGLIRKDENYNYKNNTNSSVVIKRYQIDYTKDYAGEYLSDNYQISQGIGNMLPSILLSTVSPVAGSISMGVSAGGNSYHQALVEGQDVMKSLFYGVVSGASEATLEKFMGGIPGLSDIPVTSFKTFAQSVVKEGIEEGTQEYIDALSRTLLFDENFKFDEVTKEAFKSGIYGAITAGILNTPSLAKNSISNVVQNYNSNKDIKNNGDGIDLNDLKYKKYNIASNALSYLESNLKKYVYKDTSSIPGLNEQIKNNGLYHFTSEAGADSIINSKYIKSSDVISSYGTKKTFFFNGVPEVGAIASNLDKLPLKTTAIRIDASDSILSSNKLKVRNLDDQAISYNGDFDLSNVKATKEYFVLEKSGNELKYKKVSQEEYNDYQNTVKGKQLQTFLDNKSNINAIKYDFLQNLQGKASTQSIDSNIKDFQNADFMSKPLFDDLLDPITKSLDSNIATNNYNSTKILDNAVNIMNNKYGVGEGFIRLVNYLMTDNPTLFTKDGNTRNLVTAIDKNDIFNYLNNIVSDFDKGNIGNDIITNDQISTIRPYVESLKKYYNNKNYKSIFNGVENYFEKYNYNNHNFGVDQGISQQHIRFQNGRKSATEYYIYAKEYLKYKYNMSALDASRLVTGFNNKGACTYAATVNDIFISYQNKALEFQRDFGYPMYFKIDGKDSLNSLPLLVDMYLFANHTDNGGKLFTSTSDGRVITTPTGLSSQLDLFGRNILSAEKQQYMTTPMVGKNEYLIDKFLKSKNPSLSYKSEMIIDSFDKTKTLSDSDIKSMQKMVSEKVLDGYQIELDVSAHQNPIKMKNLSGGKDYTPKGGHAVFVTNMTDEGFVVSSWGQKYFISFSDLKEGSFILNASKINK